MACEIWQSCNNFNSLVRQIYGETKTIFFHKKREQKINKNGGTAFEQAGLMTDRKRP